LAIFVLAFDHNDSVGANLSKIELIKLLILSKSSYFKILIKNVHLLLSYQFNLAYHFDLPSLNDQKIILVLFLFYPKGYSILYKLMF